MIPPLSRRALLRVGIGSAIAAVTGGAAVRAAPPYPPAFARPDLIHMLGDARLVREIGRAYRACFPDEDPAAALQAALAAACDAQAAADQSRLRPWLQHRIREDFRAGRTVELHGWILAQTEARQCALYSLLPS